MKIADSSTPARSRRSTRRRRRPTFLQSHPTLFYIIIAIIILAALNFALLLPSLVASIFYEIEQFFIRLFLLPITLNRIELFILLAIVAAISYFIIPIVWIPNLETAFFYKRVYPEGDFMVFERFRGKPLKVRSEWIRKKWLKYVVIGKAEVIGEVDDAIIIDGEDLASIANYLNIRLMEAYQERIRRLEEEIANAREIFPPPQEGGEE